MAYTADLLKYTVEWTREILWYQRVTFTLNWVVITAALSPQWIVKCRITGNCSRIFVGIKILSLIALSFLTPASLHCDQQKMASIPSGRGTVQGFLSESRSCHWSHPLSSHTHHLDVRKRRGADVGTDHHFLIANIRLKTAYQTLPLQKKSLILLENRLTMINIIGDGSISEILY